MGKQERFVKVVENDLNDIHYGFIVMCCGFGLIMIMAYFDPLTVAMLGVLLIVLSLIFAVLHRKVYWVKQK